MKPIFAAILFVGCIACTTRLYIPGEANVNKVEPASLIELQQGHDLFQNKCGKCHKLPKPDKYLIISFLLGSLSLSKSL